MCCKRKVYLSGRAEFFESVLEEVEDGGALELARGEVNLPSFLDEDRRLL
jgi:hypothetical protein